MPYLVAVSGASGSGKSTFADALRTYLESRQKTVCVIAADRYFKKDLPKMISPADGEEYSDWNHPDSVDMPAFLAAVREAMDSGEYDFVLIEGVTIFCHEAIREMADVKLYVDASIEMRIYRRIARNVVTMGRPSSSSAVTTSSAPATAKRNIPSRPPNMPTGILTTSGASISTRKAQKS